MSVLFSLDSWRADGTIREEQYAALVAVVRKDRFSGFLELNALLYLGVVALVAGVGWTVHEYLARVSDVAILGGLTFILAACSYYCASRGASYTTAVVPTPTFASLLPTSW